MGRYRVDKIYWQEEDWATEKIIAHAFLSVHRHSDVTIEIACHLFANANKYHDDELNKVGIELMRAAGSPCRFVTDDSAENATDNNNRPSVPIAPAIPAELLDNEEGEFDEEWDSSRDGIFDKKINPQAVKKAIDSVESEKIKDRPFFYVAFVILKILKYIPYNTSPRDFLLWVIFHFKCRWAEDPEKKHQLYFRLEGILKELSKKHPSEWKDAKDNNGEEFWGNLNLDYYNLAISFKNAFTMVMVKDKPIDDSESFEHLRDRVELLSAARDVYGTLVAPEEAYINNGK